MMTLLAGLPFAPALSGMKDMDKYIYYFTCIF